LIVRAPDSIFKFLLDSRAVAFPERIRNAPSAFDLLGHGQADISANILGEHRPAPEARGNDEERRTHIHRDHSTKIVTCLSIWLPARALTRPLTCSKNDGNDAPELSL
jgi:hypothetical protein